MWTSGRVPSYSTPSLLSQAPPAPAIKPLPRGSPRCPRAGGTSPECYQNQTGTQKKKKKKCVCLLERTRREQTKSHLSGMKVGCVEGYKYTEEDYIAVTFLFFAISKVSGRG